MFKVHAQLLRGTLHALWRMEDEALRDLQAVINTQGQPSQMYVNALIKRAGIFAGQQNMDKCKTCLEKALAVCPDSIDVLVHRARVCLESEEMSNLDSVVEDLTKAVERAPQQPYPIYSLASSFHRLASISQSMQLIQTARIKFQEALRKFPTFADGLILYALFLQDTGEFQQAEEVLNKVVQVEPDNPLGYFSLGLLHLVVRSDIDQTMIHMQKAIAVDISCVQAYDTIASIEMQRGHTARAMELYEKAVHYSRNQVEMTQAYVAQKVFSMQDKVCKEYGVSIQQLAARSAASMTPPGAPNM
jgi:import receptor subunit TOM70